MTKTKPTLGKLIELAIEMERKAYDFYKYLEIRFSDRTEFVECLCGIKEDELLHLRVLKEIKASLSDVRLLAPIPETTMAHMERVRSFLDDLDMDSLNTADQIFDAIQELETVEFDIVLDFVEISEIDFQFTKDYLKSQSVDHMKKVYKAQQCFE